MEEDLDKVLGRWQMLPATAQDVVIGMLALHMSALNAFLEDERRNKRAVIQTAIDVLEATRG